jgi:oligopeptidase B
VRYPVVLFVLGAVLLTSGCGGDSGPPKAKVEPHEIEKHGHVRVDDYFGLKQRHNPEVIAYLEAENAYTKTVTAQSRALRETLFEEIKGRIKKDDSSVPYRLDGFYYYSRYEEGDEYPYYCRKKGSLDADEQIMLDANELAEGHDYLAVRGVVVTLDTTIMAFAVDTVGRRKYTIRFRDLGTGEFLDDPIVDVTGNIAWANDNKTLFYAKQDPDTLRSYQIWRHTLGTDPADDVLVFQEDDETFSTYVWKTKSRKYVMIGSFQTVSSEVRYLDANEPMGEFTVFLPRERDHEYNIDHAGDEFFIRTNWDATNFRLMKTPVTRTAKDHWTEVIPHRDDVLFEDFELFKDFLTIGERHDGLIQVRIRPRAGGEEHYLDFGEPAYVAYFDDNKEFDTPVLRYGYSSLTTPRSVFDYDMTTREKELKKQDEVLGGFDRENYVSERLHAKARDGVNVPISLVYRKGFEKNRSAPLLLYGYGSYGNSIDPSFRSDRLSLIDRGFVFAIAHVRGGEELGRRWYEDGKLFNKKNTFTDFIDCAEYLIERGYAAPDGVFAYGGSAGGLLVGAVINMRPDLFNGAVAAVPFVDVVTTMLDDDIPLTTSEYDEWGDPNKKDYYDYILSYSPYDNVEAKSYPNLLVTTGLHDSQVQYWEPAKWVAKLRATKTDDNVLLLRTNMDAGHGGKSGRFRRYEETAFIYAFLLELADKN